MATNTIKLDKEKSRIIVPGKLIKLNYAPLVYKDAKGVERKSEVSYYQLCVATAYNDVNKATADAIRETYYSGVSADFVPGWLKNAPETGKDLLVNFKSRYDVKHFVRSDSENPFAPTASDDWTAIGYNDLIAKYTSVIGSDVTVSAKCKDGAIYVDAIRYDVMHTVDVKDYF